MSMSPKITITPLNPLASYVDSAGGSTAKTIYGYLYQYGGYSNYYYNLNKQYNEDILYIYETERLSTDVSEPYNFSRQSVFWVVLSTRNLEPNDQILAVFNLENIWGQGHAQFFVDYVHAGTEQITGNENHAILFDIVPNDNYYSLLARLAKDTYSTCLGFRSCEIFLI